MDFSKVILISAVVGLIGLALGVQWWSTKPKQIPPAPVPVVTKHIISPKIQQPLEKPTIPQPANQPQVVVATPPLTPQLPKEPPVTEQKIYSSKTDIVRNDVVNDSRSQISNRQELQQDGSGLEVSGSDSVSKMSDQSQAGDESQLTQDIAEPDQLSTVAILPAEQGGQWLLDQPVENYTLQLMALSKEQDIIAVMQKNQALGQNLRYLKAKTKSGKDRFVLFYGSFSSSEQASLEAKNLPKELQKAWKRKIGAVQSEIKLTGQPPVLP
jgi:DamX protein